MSDNDNELFEILNRLDAIETRVAAHRIDLIDLALVVKDQTATALPPSFATEIWIDQLETIMRRLGGPG